MFFFLMFENHVIRQKNNSIYKSKVHAVFFISRKSIGWAGSKVGREVNGHRAKIQGPVHKGMDWCDKQAVRGTTRRGRRQWQ